MWGDLTGKIPDPYETFTLTDRVQYEMNPGQSSVQTSLAAFLKATLYTEQERHGH